MPKLPTSRRRRAEQAEAVAKAELLPAALRAAVNANPPLNQGRIVDMDAWARRTASKLAPDMGETPADIEQALIEQGIEWVERFAPGRPLEPAYGYGRQPREFNFVPGRNVQVTPRQDRIPFGTLDELIRSYDVAKICIRHLINDVRSLPILFHPKKGYTKDAGAEIEQAKAFLRRPDNKRKFKSWLAMWMQDILRYDAGTLYKKRDRAGRIIGLQVISGTTIAPMVDYFGDIPEPPAPAYVQVIEGLPWDWLTANDLIYEPLNPIRESPYGMAPIEDIILNANTDVRFQLYFLQFFTKGTVPEGFMEAPPDQSSPDQLVEFQEIWDAVMMGDQEKLRQIRWVPAGAKYTAVKNSTFQDEFALYLMRRTCAAYGVTPNDLGFTDNVNKATGDTQVDVQFRVGTQPLVDHIEEILNNILSEDLHLPVEMHFDTGREKEDRLAEAQAWREYVEMGAASPDEPRDKVLGLPVNPLEPTPRFVMSRYGPVPVKSIMEISGDVDPNTAAPVPGSVDKVDLPPGSYMPPRGVGEKNQGQQQINAELGTGGDDEVDLPTADPIDFKSSTDTVSKSLQKWRKNAHNRVQRGEAPRQFEGLPEGVTNTVWQQLQGASSHDQVDEAFVKARNELRDQQGRHSPVPKVPARPGPGGRAEEDLVGRHAQTVQAALASSAVASSLVAAWLLSGVVPSLAAAMAFLAAYEWNDEPLADQVRAMRSEAYAAGFAAASDDAVPPTPSSPALSDWPLTVHGIDRTTMSRLANLLADSDQVPLEDLVQEVADVLDNPSRAMTITVTEVNRAISQGEIDAYQHLLHNQWEWVNQAGACPACVEQAQGGPYPMGRLPMPPLHPNCLPGSVRVAPGWVVTGEVGRGEALDPVPDRSVGDGGVATTATAAVAERDRLRGHLRAATQREFVGDLIEIELASGHKLSATPNHPIATPSGWVGIADLQVGDDVLHGTRLEWGPLGIDPDEDDIPPRLEEVAQALTVALRAMPSATEDFHGDGTGSDVYVVLADGALLDRGEALCHELLGEAAFCRRHVALALLDPQGATGQLLLSRLLASSGGMGPLGEPPTLVGAGPSHADGHRPAAATNGDALVAEHPADGAAVDSEGFCEGLLALSSEIATSDVVAIRRLPFSGHVYNLDTFDGWYMGNGIVTHNCRCGTRPV